MISVTESRGGKKQKENLFTQVQRKLDISAAKMEPGSGESILEEKVTEETAAISLLFTVNIKTVAASKRETCRNKFQSITTLNWLDSISGTKHSLCCGARLQNISICKSSPTARQSISPCRSSHLIYQSLPISTIYHPPFLPFLS